jgi:hypothetical protein
MTAQPCSIVIHGHFYQPPREDPWLGDVETEISAAPWHDWNQRIERECYRAVVAARIPAADGRIARIVNTLGSISFDFGPTLLEWMEREAPQTYAAVLDADRMSQATFGTGSAMAMPYHHAILPLCTRRDKVTEVRWGMADFRRRFQREPEGMWLPETAVDEETLEVLAAEGIRFTVLAPNQVEVVPPRGEPALFRAAGGQSLAVFIYDGSLSHDIAFGPLLHDAGTWRARLLERAADGSRLISMATDGETYGHHHPFGEMALAALLEDLGGRREVRVENYGSYLARHRPKTGVKLVAPSSWSCAHGVERWRSDCGCRTDPATHQRWRAPLRDALDWLAGELHRRFDDEGAAVLPDPWSARDAYGVTGLPGIPLRARELLEMERNALRMFTSCGWFFNDIGGIETVQVMRYAARAIDLVGDPDSTLGAGFAERLAAAASNDPQLGDGRSIFERQVLPAAAPAARVAAAARAAAEIAPGHGVELPGYATSRDGECVTVRDRRTGREWRYPVRFRRPSVARLEVAVGEAAVGLPDFPERHRDAVLDAITHAVIEECLTEQERRALASGGITPAAAAAGAVQRAVERLDRDQSADAFDLLENLLDFLDLMGNHIPFDAQTAFYRLWTRPAAGRSPRLSQIARRLGFTVTA